MEDHMVKKAVFSSFAFALVFFIGGSVDIFGQQRTAPRAGANTRQPAANSVARPNTPAPRPAPTASETGDAFASPVQQQTTQTPTSDPNALDSIPEVREGLEFLKTGEREKAAEKFAAAYKKRPDLAPAGVAVAVALANEKRFDQVRYWLEKSVDDCPNDPEAYVILAEVAEAEGRLLEARLLADQTATLVGNYKSNPERQKKIAQRSQLVLVKIAEKKENWTEAKSRLEALIGRAPNEAEYYTRLGVIYFQMNDLKKSLETFGTAIEKGSKLPPPYALVAQLLDQKGRTPEAKTYMSEAIKTNSNHFQVLSIAANLAVKWELVSQAKVYADRALKIQPDSLDAMAMCGLIALYEKDFVQAQKYYEDILKQQPNNFYGRNGLVLALCEQQDPQKIQLALDTAQQNAQQNPQSIEAISTFAWAAFKAGQTESAEQLLNRVQSTGVISATGVYYLAEIKSKQGNAEQALALINVALGTKNNYPKRSAAMELQQNLQKVAVQRQQ